MAGAARSKANSTFGVVRQLFEGIVRTLGPSGQAGVLSGPAGLAAGLLGRPGDVAGPDLLPLLHSLYWLTADLGATQPLLVSVDDAHRADSASLRYLEYLARRLDELPVAVVVASRPPEPHDDPDPLARIRAQPNSQVILPSPLTEDAVARLVADSLDGPADAKFSHACHEATGGNPFLVHHLLATLQEDGVVSSAAFTPAVFTAAPNAVKRATQIRLGSLPPEAARLAEAVAVLGDDARLAMAAKLAELDHDPAATASDRLAAVGILRSGQPAAPPERIEDLEVAVKEAGSGLGRPLPQDAEGGLTNGRACRRAGRVAEAGIGRSGTRRQRSSGVIHFARAEAVGQGGAARLVGRWGPFVDVGSCRYRERRGPDALARHRAG